VEGLGTPFTPSIAIIVNSRDESFVGRKFFKLIPLQSLSLPFEFSDDPDRVLLASQTQRFSPRISGFWPR
jgi:hypothetical protein